MSFPYKLDVEPGLQRSSLYSRDMISSRYSASPTGKTKTIIVPRDSRTNRACVDNNEKVLNSTIKHKHHIGSKNAKEGESKEMEAEGRYITIGTNTHITGPLKCYHHIRKRDSCDCQLSHHKDKRPNSKMRAKEIQAIIPKSFFLADKACAQFIETSNCGTQFFEQFVSPLHPVLGSYVTQTSTSTSANIEQQVSGEDNKLSTFKVSGVLPLNRDNETAMSPTYSGIVEDCLSSIGLNNFSPRRESSKRWAISPCSFLGPDF